MRTLSIYWFFIITFLTLSCERDEPDFSKVDCDYCYTIEPDSAELWVELSLDDQNQYIPLIIYKGHLEDGVIEYTDTSYWETYYLYVPVNEYYTVQAKYIDGQDTIFVIDGDKIKTRKNTTDCSEECYTIVGGYYNLKLDP